MKNSKKENGTLRYLFYETSPLAFRSKREGKRTVGAILAESSRLEGGARNARGGLTQAEDSETGAQ